MKKLSGLVLLTVSGFAWSSQDSNVALFYYCHQGGNQYQEAATTQLQTIVKYHQGPFMEIVQVQPEVEHSEVLRKQLFDAGITSQCASYLLSKAKWVTGSEHELQARVLFAFDSAELNEQSHYILDQVNEQLELTQPNSVVVVGNTDSLGSDKYNFELGTKRSERVSKQLLQFEKGLLIQRTDGELNPVQSNASSVGRASNRRVDLHMLPDNS